MLSEVLSLPRDRTVRLVALGAHADDIEIGAGGTIARLLAERPDTNVTWVVFSADGARAMEARASAATILGGAAGRVEVLEGRDGFLPYDRPGQLKDALLALRGDGPDVVLAHRREDLHQDHAFVAALAWQVFRSAPILEYEVPKYEGDLGAPNLYVPLDGAGATAKVEAILRDFPSQAHHDWFTADTLRAVLRLRGLECRAPSGYAEAFTCRRLVVPGRPDSTPRRAR